MKQVVNITLVKKNGKLVPKSLLAKEQYRIFISGLTDGEQVEALFELKGVDGTKAQLAKIHTSISEMAKEQGHSVLEMKNIVKKECGYKVDDKGEYESFAGKSKSDLSQVIDTIITMGQFMNINFQNLK